MKLTKNQYNILKYLYDNRKSKLTPTNIGHKVGGYNGRGTLRHSAWACPILKSLINKGLVKMYSKGLYKINELGILKINRS